MIRIAVLAVVGAVVAAGCASGGSRVVVAAGTTIVDAGFIDALAEKYEAANPEVEISVVANPTRLILELGRQKAADLLLTHAPVQEASFIDEGLASSFSPVFTSSFVLIGPAGALGETEGLEIPEVLRTIAAEEHLFVSRGDGSGTNDAELEAWFEAGIDPRDEPWYLLTGQGMGPTLLVADQRDGITLSELGSYVAASSTLSLVDYQVDPEGLENPYTGIVVAGSDAETAASAFLDWLTSGEGQAAVSEVNNDLFGSDVYRPVNAPG